MLTHITVAGLQMPVNFGMNALREFTKAAGIKLADLGNLTDIDLDQICLLAYYAVKWGCKRERLEFEYTFEDFCEHINMNTIGEVLEGFADAMTLPEKNGEAAAKKRKPLN